MGYQILRQPSDADPSLYALFSSSSDTIVMYDATEEDVHEFFRERAIEDARRSTQRCLDAVKAGKPRQAYYQFALTWDEALAEEPGARRRGVAGVRDGGCRGRRVGSACYGRHLDEAPDGGP